MIPYKSKVKIVGGFFIGQTGIVISEFISGAVFKKYEYGVLIDGESYKYEHILEKNLEIIGDKNNGK